MAGAKRGATLAQRKTTDATPAQRKSAAASSVQTKPDEAAGAPELRPAAATVHLVGGAELQVVQGAGVVNRRLEEAIDSRKAHAALTEPRGRVAYINPLGVRYLVQEPGPRRRNASSGNGREPNACVHFVDGSVLDVLQGIGVANKRLDEARESAGLFASLTEPSGTIVFVNHHAVTHLTAS